MTPRCVVRVLAAAIAVGLVGCGPFDSSPTARPTPIPQAPALRSQSGSFDGHTWIESVIVDPHGATTQLVLEWGPPGEFTDVLAMATVEEVGRQSIATTAIPSDREVCIRFHATNRLGEATLETGCFGAPFPSGPPGVPASP